MRRLMVIVLKRWTVGHDMNDLLERDIQCPYCGESQTILIDGSVMQQAYIEDCQVCCRPINFDVTVDIKGRPSVVVSHENE